VWPAAWQRLRAFAAARRASRYDWRFLSMYESIQIAGQTGHNNNAFE